MNNDMLQNIEYLRERANVSYEEAQRLLEENGGDVMAALVELEHQGRVFSQTTSQQGHYYAQCPPNGSWKPESDGIKKAKGFAKAAMGTHIVVENTSTEKRKEIANVPAPFAVLMTLAAPWLTVITAGIVYATGHNLRIKKEKETQEETQFQQGE